MTNDKKLLEISCKEMLMEIIKKSKKIDKKLNFYEKTILYDIVEQMSFEEVASILFYDNISEASREIETKDERDTKYGAAMTVGGAAPLAAKKLLKGKSPITLKKVGVGAALGVGALFLYRKLTDPCFKQTMRILNPAKRKTAELECRLGAIKRVIGKIQNDIQRCGSAPNPESCKDKLTGELNKWRNKYQEHLHKISTLRDNK